MARKPKSEFHFYVRISGSTYFENDRAKRCLHRELSQLPPDLSYALRSPAPADPPAFFVQVVGYLSQKHPFRLGWMAAMAGKPWTSVSLGFSPTNRAIWLEGWDMARLHWPSIERKRYATAKSAAAQAPVSFPARNENHSAPKK